MSDQKKCAIYEKLEQVHSKDVARIVEILSREFECHILNYESLCKWCGLCRDERITHPELTQALSVLSEEDRLRLIALYVGECINYSETFSMSSLLEDTRQYLETYYDVDELIYERIATVSQQAMSKLTNEEKDALATGSYHEFSNLDIDDLVLDEDNLFDYATNIADNRAFDLDVVFDDGSLGKIYIMRDSIERLARKDKRTTAVLDALCNLEDDMQFGSVDEWIRYKNSSKLSSKLATELSMKNCSSRIKM